MQEPDKKKEKIRNDLEKAISTGAGPSLVRCMLAILSGTASFLDTAAQAPVGSLAGGVLSGAIGIWSEVEQDRIYNLVLSWLKLQQDEIQEIGQTLIEVMSRLDQSDDNIRRRIESPEYLRLVKKCFRDWSAAESEQKRVLIRNLLSNAASSQICSDDILRMFIDWINIYSESHFAVIAEIFHNKNISRKRIWLNIYSSIPREDPEQADLYKLLFRDLSTGQIIRQHTEKTVDGRFKNRKSNKGVKLGSGYSSYKKSAFDDVEQYELTSLGTQFVFYAMNDIVPKIENS